MASTVSSEIVLPLPGFDVVYPPNESGEWYKTFMASEAGGGLDPYDMRRKQKDFSLSGGYRKVLARIGQDSEVSVHEYLDEEGDKQFVETDMEKIKKAQARRGASMQEAAAEEQVRRRRRRKQPEWAIGHQLQPNSPQYSSSNLPRVNMRQWHFENCPREVLEHTSQNLWVEDSGTLD